MTTTTFGDISTLVTPDESKESTGGALRGRGRRFPATPERAARVLQSRDAAVLARHVKLSILMPAYNEERTIAEAVREVLACDYPWPFELIVVDDGSSDRTREIVESLQHPRLVLVQHGRNLGKGAALQSAAAVSTGTHLVPFDADLEYAPFDLIALMAPITSGRAEVVYGPRMFGVNTRYQSYRHAMGNRVLTLTANVLFDSYLSDMHTCLKVLPATLFEDLALSEDGFGLDTEITAKILKLGIRPFEVPVSYYSRSVAQGKKITWRDGVECLQVLARVRWAASHRPTEVHAGAPAGFRLVHDAVQNGPADDHSAQLVS